MKKMLIIRPDYDIGTNYLFLWSQKVIDYAIEKGWHVEKSDREKATTEEKEVATFKGKFVRAIGRRKTATADVRLYKSGKGVILVNDQPLKKYFTAAEVVILQQPLKLTGHLRDLDFSIVISGSGKKSQAGAASHGISRALLLMDKDLRGSLKTKSMLTRDDRKKERKKPGLKRARRAPQWSKR